MNQVNGDVKAIIETVERLSAPQVMYFNHPQRKGETVPVLVTSTREGSRVSSVKSLVDEYLDAPRRLHGCASAETLGSFCDLVNQHKTTNTVVFASHGALSLLAVIDYHGRGALGEGSSPSFCGHRVQYTFPKTPEFELWERTTEWRSQAAFATFLDERRFDLIDPLDVEPLEEGTILHDVTLRSVSRDKRGSLNDRLPTIFASPGDIAQLVETLCGHSRTKFAEVRTDRFGGLRATIEKEGRIEGDEKIPHLFLLQLAAFTGGNKLVLPARIRARVFNEKLQLSAELIGAERITQMAINAAAAEVEAKTACKVFWGLPET